jgi:hypothetical protein
MKKVVGDLLPPARGMLATLEEFLLDYTPEEVEQDVGILQYGGADRCCRCPLSERD